LLRPDSGLQTLLVPLDGSLLAEHALPRALAIARRSGAAIRLVHVYSPLASTEDPWRFYSRRLLVDVDQRRMGDMQAYLNGVVRRIARRDSVRVVTIISESARTAEQLSAAAEGVDLIVMATHAWSRLGRLWYGSMADAVLRKVSCPLLLVRGCSSPVDLTGDPIARKVVIPLDGSQGSEQILPCAAELGQLAGSAVTLLYVEPSGQVPGHLSKSDAQAYLRNTAEGLKDRLGTVFTRIVQGDVKSPQAILSFAAEDEADLVAITARVRDGIARFARDSVAEVLLRRPGMAVLVVRLNEPRNEGARK
jgi:nucleotide-binding universal stress UspA family protein